MSTSHLNAVIATAVLYWGDAAGHLMQLVAHGNTAPNNVWTIPTDLLLPLGAVVLLIAHRLTTLTEVDRIFVLDRGRLVEHGTHPELMTRSGLYRTLYDEQMRRLAEA